MSVPGFEYVLNPALAGVYTDAGATFVDVTKATGGEIPLTRSTPLGPQGSVPVAVADVCALTSMCRTQGVPPGVDDAPAKIPRPGDEARGASGAHCETAARAARPKELVTMNRNCKPVIVVLGALTALDLVAAVLASRVTGTAKPPPPAVVSMLILAVLTVAAMYGLWRGARWARPVVYVTRGFDVLSGLLGLADRPSVALDVIGVVTILLSLAAIVMLARIPAAELTPGHGMG